MAPMFARVGEKKIGRAVAVGAAGISLGATALGTAEGFANYRICALGAGPFRQGSALSTPSIFATTGSIQPKCSMSRSCEGPVGTNRTASNPSRDVFLDREAINDVTCQLKYCFTSFRGAIWKGMRKCAIGNQARSVCVTQMVRRAIDDAAAYFGFFRDGRRFRDVPRT